MSKGAKVLDMPAPPSPDRSGSHGHEAGPVAAFVRAFNESQKVRTRYRNPNQRGRLLEAWGLADDPRFQSGEEFWLPVPDEPVRNPDYDPDA